ncbi:MAG: glycine--tRNA ligase subunit beta [Candidatus Margulisbacteria bacterium]|nr:glycine--tRNA ligase subunit beta [Candidatus Margulisiibacteriota bacterium]
MNYILEIGTEEIPARFVAELIQDLKNNIETALRESLLHFKVIKSFATYRRLAVMVCDLAAQQDDLTQEFKGPPAKIAMNTDGSYTPAGLGFLKKQNVTEGTVKESYLYAKVFQKGKKTEEILGALILRSIKNIHLPLTMKWGVEDEPFIRPVHWILSLLDNTIIPLTFAGQSAADITYGHRFLSDNDSLFGKKVVLNKAGDYEANLNKYQVIAALDQRKKEIISQIQTFDKDMAIPEDLLDEVTSLVEFPTVLKGNFPEDFLQIPERILITTMQKHQKYFAIHKKGRLTNNFLIVADNVTSTNKPTIINGNERVLKARLHDARFYYQEDIKHDFAFFLEKLKNVTFQQKLGSMKDKTDRNLLCAKEIYPLIKLSATDQKITDSIIKLAKADLATTMVFEFTELQGYIGQQYALQWGYDKIVADGILEHYYPVFAGDKLPTTIYASIASLSDKIDTVSSHFALNHIPSGSNDPYGLRRQANGILQILFENEQLALDLNILLQKSLQSIPNVSDRPKVLVELTDFFLLRMESLLKDKGLSIDVVKAINTLNIKQLKKRFTFLPLLQASEPYKLVAEAAVRINNICKNFPESREIKPALFEHDIEKQLLKSYENIQKELAKPWDKTLTEKLSDFARLIDKYFDKVMVMVDNTDLKNNRLSLLKNIDNFFKEIADFKALVITAK